MGNLVFSVLEFMSLGSEFNWCRRTKHAISIKNVPILNGTNVCCCGAWPSAQRFMWNLNGPNFKNAFHSTAAFMSKLFLNFILTEGFRIFLNAYSTCAPSHTHTHTNTFCTLCMWVLTLGASGITHTQTHTKTHANTRNWCAFGSIRQSKIRTLFLVAMSVVFEQARSSAWTIFNIFMRACMCLCVPLSLSLCVCVLSLGEIYFCCWFWYVAMYVGLMRQLPWIPIHYKDYKLCYVFGHVADEMIWWYRRRRHCTHILKHLFALSPFCHSGGGGGGALVLCAFRNMAPIHINITHNCHSQIVDHGREWDRTLLYPHPYIHHYEYTNKSQNILKNLMKMENGSFSP